MNLGKIIRQARIELDDTEPDYLWSDAELIGYAQEAEEQAARRARLLIDSTTPAICTITLVAGQSEYDLDQRIINVRSATPSYRARPLVFSTVSILDEESPNWRNREGPPGVVVADYQTGVLKLTPTPTSAEEGETINLRVTRIPLDPMTDMEDVPEIKAMYHRGLIHWIKHKAYLKKDTDTLDEQESAKALALFEQEFGPAKAAWSDEFDLRNLPFSNSDGMY
jgi:hypothetical protein